MADDFDEMIGDDDSGGPPQAVMWIRSPAVNSIELQLLSMMAREPLLPLDVEFLDGGDDVPAPEDREMESPALSAIRSQVAEHWLTHIALARSLGPGASINAYASACLREGLRPKNIPQ